MALINSSEAAGDGAESPQPLVPPQQEAMNRAHLGPRERAIAAEIQRFGADLAGLFTLGHELLGRLDEPGVSLLLLHAGRELSQGVLSASAGREPELTEAEDRSVPANEKHRRTIARALRLPNTHPVVSAWFSLHSRLASQAHFSPERAPDPRVVAADFRLLVSLIAGRIEPYFDLQDRAEQLLAESNPGAGHQRALAEVMVRPTLRRHFFRRLKSAGWLSLLKSQGVFESPPMRRVHPDGTWSVVPWVEGEYLARIAGTAPEAVREILEGVPASNDNPAVWDAFARALCSLEMPDAVALAPRLIRGITSVPTVLSVDSIVAAARRVGTVDVSVALNVASALLWMPMRPAVERDAEAFGHVSDWILLSRISDYSAEIVVDELLVPLAAAAPAEVLRFLCQKLTVAIRATDEPSRAGDSRHSYSWCRDLEGSGERDGLRATLARTAANIAVTLAATSEGSAQEAYEILGSLPAGLGQRVRLFLIARVRPFLTKWLDEVVGDDDLFAWSQPGREVGELLRSRVTDASADAREKLIATMLRGPREQEIESRIRWAAQAGETLTRDDAIKHWQLRHLRRFTTGVPDFLSPVAASAGFDGTTADAQELALTEVGWYSGGVTWGSERSPLNASELKSLSDDALAARIATWEEVEGMDNPSLRGLEDSMEHLSAEHPSRGLLVALKLIRTHATSRGATGVLRGVRRAMESGKEAPHHLVMDLVGSIVAPDAHTLGSELLSSALDMLGASVETVPAANLGDHADLALDCLTCALRVSRHGGDNLNTMNGVLAAALNDPAGKAMAAAIRLAIRLKRDVADSDGEEWRRVVLRLRDAIDGAIRADGVGGVASQAAIGCWLPHLVWLDGPWWAERAVEIIGSSVSDPMQNPVWSAYLAGRRFYDETFRELRPYYVQAARQTTPGIPASRSREWEPERKLIEHVLIAYHRGLVTIGGDDSLLELTVRNVPVQDLGHAYWQIYRSWTDAHQDSLEGVPQEHIDRLVALWRWRIHELRSSAATERTAAEAAGLLWFFLVPQLPAQAVLELGFESLRLARGDLSILHLFWGRLAELAESSADEVQRLVSLVIDRELSTPYPSLSLSEVGPVFRAIFARGSSRSRAAALEALHRAGDAGFTELGSLRSASA